MLNLREELLGLDKEINLDNDTVEFNGDNSEEFQKIIDSNVGKVILVSSDTIYVDESINLPADTTIIGNNVKLIPDGTEMVFTSEDTENIIIDSFTINSGADYGLFLVDVSNVQISNCKFSGLEQKPICIIGKSQYFKIDNNEFSNNNAGGIYISGNVGYGIIENNNIHDNYGTSNWMAGIVLTNVETSDPMYIWETFDESHHFPQKDNLYSQINAPHNILIENNQVCWNNASGIYSDEAYNCLVINNDVVENDKEGICLDYGTIGFYLTDNLFDGNGCRARQTDDDLNMDFVLDAGRMDDGSAKSKLPGISLDNTAYNILENNTVVNNYGGGIKMVRTTIRTLIYENIIKDNNMGQNDSFHFFGIELGSAIADVDATDMDFTPDYENIICRNTISGDHYSGIFIGDEGYVNDVLDNVIMESRMFAIEAISLRLNLIVNNISNADNHIEYQN